MDDSEKPSLRTDMLEGFLLWFTGPLGLVYFTVRELRRRKRAR